MVARLSVSLVQQVIDIHHAVLKVGHGITHKTVLRHRKQGKCLFPALAGNFLRVR